MTKNIARLIVASALALAPAAFAQPHTTPVPTHDHTPVVHDHTPTVQGHTVTAHR